MAFYHRTNSERKRMQHDYRRQEEEVIGSLCRLDSQPVSPATLLEQEKRIRREIANSNERRRMQSINAGFQSLRALLPHRDGEKLSKAAILQSTADYVYQLEQEKTRLLEQNSQLSRRVLNSHSDSDGSCSDSPLPKRKKREIVDSIDEGIGSASPSRSESDEAKHEIVQLRIQLEHERSLRLLLEEELKNMEAQLFNSGKNPVNRIHIIDYEDTGKSSMNLGHESGLGSPQSQVSSQESNQDFPLRESSSPELSIAEVPEDLSGKNNSMLLPCVGELSISDVSNIPGMLLPSSPMNDVSHLSLELNSNQAPYKVNTSKQNLEAIVEAIRHVEGDHMFRDDPLSPKSEAFDQNKLSVTTEQFEEQSQKSVHSLTHVAFSFQHQIIRNAPLIQSRPGVIVSNLS
ncbi:hypothetical protein JTE90_015984 [Oedothorax gibbosus]|uniref:BHLH domain-containing protein n=1 Tax=Oedothorax gibbosus TaxID=931172 RepID=A0AAV6VSC2_9ARAC|nr:hypothetical protein JTE90_015984 [Oedothorax gibbosus]